MITHTIKPGEVIEQISDIFTARDFHIPKISYQFICRSGGQYAYGFWINARARTFGFTEMRELIGLFHSGGFKLLSIMNRQSDTRL